MERETENQIKERREERKRIKKRNAAKRKAKKKFFIVLRYLAVTLACGLLYLFAFTTYSPIKREDATVVSVLVNNAEQKQVIVSGRSRRTHNYIELSTSEGEFYFELSNNPYETIETAELFEELKGKGNVTIIVSGRRPDFHSQWTHAGNDEAIEVSDGEQVFGSLEEYNDTLKDDLVAFCLIPTIIFIFTISLFLFIDLSGFFYDLKEKRRLRKKYNKTDG